MKLDLHRGVLAIALAFATLSLACPGDAAAQPFGKGRNDPAFAADREVFRYLLANRQDIRRTVKKLDDGVETVTESNRAEVAKRIQEHALAMHRRVKKGKGIHLRDPLFAELFRNHDKITMTVEKTARGVKVSETSADRRVARLIQAHADVVSKFIANGHAEVMKNHPVPGGDAGRR